MSTSFNLNTILYKFGLYYNLYYSNSSTSHHIWNYILFDASVKAKHLVLFDLFVWSNKLETDHTHQMWIYVENCGFKKYQENETGSLLIQFTQLCLFMSP